MAHGVMSCQMIQFQTDLRAAGGVDKPRLGSGVRIVRIGERRREGDVYSGCRYDRSVTIGPACMDSCAQIGHIRETGWCGQVLSFL